MIDPFDAALSAFIDTLPEEPAAAQQLLSESAPFSGQEDLPALAELATMLRAVEPYQPRPEWMAASKARLMAAPALPPEKRGFTWLGSMFLPLTQLSFPALSLPRLNLTSPLVARGAVALALIAGLASVSRHRAAQNPILEMTASSSQLENAQQAIAATQAEVARLAQGGQVAGVEIEGSPRDIVLLSQQIDLAELAIEDAPPADQPALRNQLQSAVKAVRFDGELEGITNGSTLQVSGVAVQADTATARQLEVGQPVSLLVSVGNNGKLQAVQVTPLPQQRSSSSTTPASPARSAPAASPSPSVSPGAAAAQQSGAASSGTSTDSASPSNSASTSSAPTGVSAAASTGGDSQAPAIGRTRKTVRIDDSDSSQSASVSTPAASIASSQSVVVTAATVSGPSPSPSAAASSHGPDDAAQTPPGLPVPSIAAVEAASSGNTPAPQPAAGGSSAPTGGSQSATVSTSSHTSAGSSQSVSASSGSSVTVGGSVSSSHSSSVVSSSSSSSSSGSGGSKVLQVVTSVSNVSVSSSSSSGSGSNSNSSGKSQNDSSKGNGKNKSKKN
jgi:hypothetical protein